MKKIKTTKIDVAKIKELNPQFEKLSKQWAKETITLVKKYAHSNPFEVDFIVTANLSNMINTISSGKGVVVCIEIAHQILMTESQELQSKKEFQEDIKPNYFG